MAASQLSPGVVIQERDFTTVSSVALANIGAIAAPFERGPVEQIVDVNSERTLISTFGKPNDTNYEFWFSAAQFLSYGGTLKTIRADGTNLKNAVSNSAAVKIKNLQNYETSYETGVSNNWTFATQTPGAYGNSLRVYMTDAGADQILTLTAPSSGNDFEFTEGEAVSAGNVSGKVYRYSIKLGIEPTVNGTFIPEESAWGTATYYKKYDRVSNGGNVYQAQEAGTSGATAPVHASGLASDDNINWLFVSAAAAATIEIGGSDQTVEVLSWNPSSRILEITIPSAGIVGFIDDTMSVVQGSVTGAIQSVTRELQVVGSQGSSPFAATNTIADTNAAAAVVEAIRDEYLEREYIPGKKWVNIAPRPGTSLYALDKGAYDDELHIIVLDGDGLLTGTPNTLLERFIGISKATDAKSTVGENNYYASVLKQTSQYIYWGSHPAAADQFATNATISEGAWGSVAANRSFNRIQSSTAVHNEPNGRHMNGGKNGSSLKFAFAQGVDDYVNTSSDFSNAYNLVSDAESVRVDYIISGPQGATRDDALAKVNAILNIVNSRKDCLAFFSPMRADIIGQTNSDVITNKVLNYFNSVGSSSYCVLDAGYKYIYDKYSDVYRYVPCNGDVAGLCLETGINQDPWFSPAGFSRGVLRNAIKLAYSPNKDQRDKLYAERVNPIVSFPGQGIILFGDKTGLGYNSAFDRINVRRLFLTLERVIGESARQQLFEQNDETSRSLFRNLVEPYLRDVQGRRGVTDFLIKCDDENNPADAVDRGEFYAEVYVKPTRTINYITLTFTATRTGVSFSEIAS
ncbi:tail sheath monomer protein [Synechococcus phage ACG-2014d]|uniref:Tail sheath monomer protein n=1 Tax=Synechococcus phage ACG-2014d TaxID=1493509 RepID=A0A0E3FU10_9CAUD|nr:tail sheath monomer protein [Synechococcus phage ACG-2014d]AIX34574.1 tail sheath monomer protein [Synechococcus phage ACG-2014d]AIX35858.1 tail sheath monomer protein [Synechococcus phage ACG-2014d]